MNDDENLATRLRNDLRDVAALVDGTAPAPPRRELVESRLGPVTRVRVQRVRRGRPAVTGAFAVVAMGVLAIAVGVSWGINQNGVAQATGSPTSWVSLAAPSATLSAATSPSGSANVGQATAVTWQTGDLSLSTPFPIEQLVPIGDRLFLIASDNGGADPTAKASGGIWSTADGLAWTKQSDMDAIKSSGTYRPTLMAASANGRGGAVVVGSEQTPDRAGRTAAWWTADGNTWANATVEGPAGAMYGVVGRPDALVAVGISFSSVPGAPGEAAAWRSTDGGSSWTTVSLPGGGKDVLSVTVWGERFVAIGRSQDANQLLLWTSSDGATWSLAQSPSDPSFAPYRLIPLGDTLAVLGHGVPGSAILTCGSDMKCARASVPTLGYTASFTEVRAGAAVSGTIVVASLSASAGTVASPDSSADASSGLAFWASTDGRNWAALTSSPSQVFVLSNLVVFRGRLVAVAAGPDLTSASAKVMVGDLR